MFAKQKSDPLNLQEAADWLRRKLMDDSVSAEDFQVYFDQYVKLVTLQHAERRDRKVSADTLATITANLIGITVILQHERAHVVATKALGFIQKLR